MVQYRGPFVLNMPEEAWFNVNMMQKDMLLALELGRQVNVPLPTTAAANEYLTAARAMGLVEKDFAIVFEVLARMSGVIKMTTARRMRHAPQSSPADAGAMRCACTGGCWRFACLKSG